MKTFSITFLSLLLIVSACKKQQTKQLTTPAPLSFEIIGKDGKSMVTSKKDSVAITYSENGSHKSFNLTIEKLEVSATDTTTSSKYNGLYITDNAFMSDLSSQSPPVRTFNFYLNGTDLGTIYVDYWAYLGAYPHPSAALTFNNVPVSSDYSIGVIGSPINLLQVQ